MVYRYLGTGIGTAFTHLDPSPEPVLGRKKDGGERGLVEGTVHCRGLLHPQARRAVQPRLQLSQFPPTSPVNTGYIRYKYGTYLATER